MKFGKYNLQLLIIAGICLIGSLYAFEFQEGFEDIESRVKQAPKEEQFKSGSEEELLGERVEGAAESTSKAIKKAARDAKFYVNGVLDDALSIRDKIQKELDKTPPGKLMEKSQQRYNGLVHMRDWLDNNVLKANSVIRTLESAADKALGIDETKSSAEIKQLYYKFLYLLYQIKQFINKIPAEIKQTSLYTKLKNLENPATALLKGIENKKNAGSKEIYSEPEGEVPEPKGAVGYGTIPKKPLEVPRIKKANGQKRPLKEIVQDLITQQQAQKLQEESSSEEAQSAIEEAIKEYNKPEPLSGSQLQEQFPPPPPSAPGTPRESFLAEKNKIENLISGAKKNIELYQTQIDKNTEDIKNFHDEQKKLAQEMATSNEQEIKEKLAQITRQINEKLEQNSRWKKGIEEFEQRIKENQAANPYFD